VLFDMTVMVYMAGDNTLEGRVVPEIIDMESGIPDDNSKLAVVVQADRGNHNNEGWEWNGAIRCRLSKRSHDSLPKKMATVVLPENVLGADIDFSDPNTLKDFIACTGREYPAHRYILILWSHGSGVDDSSAKTSDPTEILLDMLIPKADFINLSPILTSLQKLFLGYAKSRALDHIGAPELKAILEDVNGSMSNKTLSDTLNSVESILQKKPLAIALDACLMGGVEIACQLRRSAHILIASETIVPGSGFDYKGLFQYLGDIDWSDIDDMTASEQIATTLVRDYGLLAPNDPYYPHSYTLTAVRLRFLDKIIYSLNALAQCLVHALESPKGPSCREEITRWRVPYKDGGVLSFSVRKDFIDLGHFTKLLMQSSILDQDSKRAARTVYECLFSRGHEDVILTEFHSVGDTTYPNDASGLTVFFPKLDQPGLLRGYSSLDFFKSSWPDFLKAFFNLPQRFDLQVKMTPKEPPVGSSCVLEVRIRNIEELAHNLSYLSVSLSTDQPLVMKLIFQPAAIDAPYDHINQCYVAQFQVFLSDQLESNRRYPIDVHVSFAGTPVLFEREPTFFLKVS